MHVIVMEMEGGGVWVGLVGQLWLELGRGEGCKVDKDGR